MNPATVPWVSCGLLSLLTGAIISKNLDSGKPTRTAASAAALLCTLCLAFAAAACVSSPAHSFVDPLVPWLKADVLNAVTMAVFAAVTAITIMMSPQRETGGNQISGLLLVSLATLTATAASHPALFVLGWCGTGIPFLAGMFGPLEYPRTFITGFFLSGISVAAASLTMHPDSSGAVPELSTSGVVLLLAAVMFRKGLFPFFPLASKPFEESNLAATNLLFNGHLGAVLVCKASLSGLNAPGAQAVRLIGDAALITALLASVRAFADRNPRRVVGFVCLSQASFILAGIATATPEGGAGALLHWTVVALASTALLNILRSVEARVTDARNPLSHLGLAAKTPRLAACFVISGLALVGLPGTLDFCAEDLLFHGALEAHPLLGLLLPLATALNAIHVIRVFQTLFLGTLPKHVHDVPDALPRERWPLAFITAFLIIGGLIPALILPLHLPAAEHLAKGLTAHLPLRPSQPTTP
jgi:formate hydrogenlyase subunit 3/multisubunit Na+/H+ antiporter MnhD subunit